MKITVSFLKSPYDVKETISRIDKTDADFIHVDIMDGIFVSNKTLDTTECLEYLRDAKKPLDIHLMVKEPLSYIEALSVLNVKYLTVHIELEDVLPLITKIHSLNIKAGLAINPETPIEKLNPYLGGIDYIIVMGVHPGAGGQELIKETVDKVNALKILREQNNYHYEICLDGGVNLNTRPMLNNADVLVSGSYICMSDDYQASITSLR